MKKATFSMAILLIASLDTPVSLAGKANAPSDPKNYPIKQNDDFIADCEVLGFNVGSDWGLYMYSDREEEDAGFNWSHKVDEYKEAGILNFSTEFKAAFLQNLRKPTYYALIFRVMCSPLQCRYNGFLGIGSHGDDWSFRSFHSKCVIDGAMIENWAPENAPQSGTATFNAGINIGKESAGEIGFSMSCAWSELKFSSNTNAAAQRYESTWSDGYYSNYTKNSSKYYGAFAFEHKGEPTVHLYQTVEYYGNSYYHKTKSSSFMHDF